MTTASDLISSARYDLRDVDSTEYTDAELLDYLNRSLEYLYSVLGALKSDWVIADDATKTLSTGSDSVSVPADFATVRSVWIGSSQLRKVDADDIYYLRKMLSASGYPNSYAIRDAYLIFDKKADQDYSLAIYYNKKASTLTLSDTIPFLNEFNQPLRQAIILMGKHRNEYNVVGDAAMYDLFMAAASAKVVMRRYVPKGYRIDF